MCIVCRCVHGTCTNYHYSRLEQESETARQLCASDTSGTASRAHRKAGRAAMNVGLPFKCSHRTAANVHVVASIVRGLNERDMLHVM